MKAGNVEILQNQSRGTEKPVPLFQKEADDTMEAFQLENEVLSVRILPKRGGKIASIYSKKEKFELLYQPRNGYPALKAGMPFSEGDASGFDDVFPSMGETYQGLYTVHFLNLPDHGEIWTSEMSVDNASNRSILLSCKGNVLPYEYRKQIVLDGRTVKLMIDIRNTGKKPLPLVWVCHCLMRLEEDTVFEFQQEDKRIFCLPGCTYPSKDALETVIDDPAYRFLVPPPDGYMMKFYFQCPVTVGQCAAYYPTSGIKAEMRFDPAYLPWLGFWITTGGYRSERNFAFEPATAYFDTWTEAEKMVRLPLIAPGKETHIQMEISLLPG